MAILFIERLDRNFRRTLAGAQMGKMIENGTLAPLGDSLPEARKGDTDKNSFSNEKQVLHTN
jgi:hypothetical protein